MANIAEEDPFLAAAKDPNGEFAKLTQKTNVKRSGARKAQASSVSGSQASSEVKEENHSRDTSGQSLPDPPTKAAPVSAGADKQPGSTSSDKWNQQHTHMGVQARPRVDEKLDTYEPVMPRDVFRASQGEYSGIAQMNIVTRVESFESSVMAEVGDLKRQVSDIKTTVMALTDKVKNRDNVGLAGSIHATDTNGSVEENGVAVDRARNPKAKDKSGEAAKRSSISISSGKSKKCGQQEGCQKPRAAQIISSDANHPAPDGDAAPVSTSQDPRFPPGTPEYVSQLKPYRSSQLQFQPLARTESPIMTRRLLLSKLGGEEFSPNFYFKAKALARLAGSPCTPAGKDGEENHHECFYLLDMETNPFAPFKPGAHGAALILFSRDAEENFRVSYSEVPVFVALPGQADRTQDQKEYIYMGHFSQTRWSDRLGYYEQKSYISEAVKNAWSDLICTMPRPAWVNKQLDEWIDRGPSWRWDVPQSGQSPECNDLDAFFEELRDAKGYCEEFKHDLNRSKVMEFFDAADSDAPAGLRFSWEYLQCVHYDRNFAYAIKSSDSADMGSNEPRTNGTEASITSDNAAVPLDSSTAALPTEKGQPAHFSWD